MPTEAHYRSAAADLRGRARTYVDAAAWAPPRPARRFVGDGPVAHRVDREFEGLLRQLVAVADELRRVAGECERRAEVCRAYRLDLARHLALPDEIRGHVPRPARPAPWVEIG